MSAAVIWTLSVCLLAVWVLGALLTIKIEAMFTARPTNYQSYLLIALVAWPGVGLAYLFTKHKASTYRDVWAR